MSTEELADRLQKLEVENTELKAYINAAITGARHHYASSDAIIGELEIAKMPKYGNSGSHCLELIRNRHLMDSNESLNTSSYVNVSFEKEELEVADMGLKINLADQTVYPESFKVHNITLNMVANLWNCPEPADFQDTMVFPGAGTVGSTEACLLGGLCLKFRWRAWYQSQHPECKNIRAVTPNLVLSTCLQNVWEKLFRYMDIEPKFVTPDSKTFTITAEGVKAQIDENTIGVVCIMGNHYAGQYDPVQEVDEMLTELNKEKGWQVGIHVDAASGGFVAPFQPEMKDVKWDFRAENVLSISASGHKFGESCCGTGWIAWREREGLSEHVAVSVSYLGGKGDSYTLNFSRPASGVYVQYYKFHRLGSKGYIDMTANRSSNAKYMRDALKAMSYQGQPRFIMCDGGDSASLPVVAAYINPELNLPYDSLDLQHAIAAYRWYVSGYKMHYTDPLTGEELPLLTDMPDSMTMFRVVVKGNVTRPMVQNLIASIEQALQNLDLIASHTMGTNRSLTKVLTLKKSSQGSSGAAC
eukprot:gene16021-22159_t